MSTRSKGTCRLCGKEYTKSSMVKHVFSCNKQKNTLEKPAAWKDMGYFGLTISGTYLKDYWLITEFKETATLLDVDQFLRDIWLECCGHLSAFRIGGISYESHPNTSISWGEPVKGMNYKLKDLLGIGMTLDYEYDFGSTTELTIQVSHYRIAKETKTKFTILSRNNPIEYLCTECGEKKAAVICAECFYDGVGLLCDDCKKDHECGEDMFLDICNSPRVGVCAYEGSSKYPD